MIDKLRGNIEKFFILFLYSQVFIDILTTLFVKSLNFPISFGMIVRFLFIVICVVYIYLKGSRGTKLLLSFLFVTIIVQGIVLFNINSNFEIFMNLRYYLRAIFFPVVTIFSYVYFFEQKKPHNVILNVINFNLIIINIVFLLSIITSFQIPMYSDGRSGISGWFLSGNEISSIMCILSFIPLYCYVQTRKFKYFFILIITLVTLLSMGTKTTFLVSIIIAILLILYLIYETIKHQKIKNLTRLIIFSGLIGLVFTFSNLIPAIKNIDYIVELENERLMKESFSENDEIPAEIKNNRYIKRKAIDADDYIAYITLNIHSKGYIGITGYFYPMYFDLSHPKFITKTLVFIDGGEELYIDLEDIYNRHVNGLIIEKTGDDSYSGDFSGLRGSIRKEFLKLNTNYDIYMDIEVEGYKKRYKVRDSIFATSDLSESVLINNGELKITSYEIMKDSKNNFKIEISKDLSDKISFLLSGRSQRLINFINKSVDYDINKLMFGTGYIKNYENHNGFEMDIPEIFVTFGILGFIVYFLIVFYLIYIVLKSGVNLFEKLLEFDKIILLIILGIIFALSFMIGHIILTPSPAIYVCLILILTTKVMMEEKNDKINQ